MLVNFPRSTVRGAARLLRDDESEGDSQDECGENGDYDNVPAAEGCIGAWFNRYDVPRIRIPVLHRLFSVLGFARLGHCAAT